MSQAINREKHLGSSQDSETENQPSGNIYSYCKGASCCLQVCVDCSEKYCVSCFMSFHQKGALKKHTTQTVEQVCLVSLTVLVSVLYCVSYCSE